jgi:hypothetical protein
MRCTWWTAVSVARSQRPGLRPTRAGTAVQSLLRGCVFDATKNGDCVTFGATRHLPADHVHRLLDCVCWTADGRRHRGRGTDLHRGPDYSDVSFIGGTVYNCNGSGGIYIGKGGTITIAGTKITGNGSSGDGQVRHLGQPLAAATTLGLNITGCTCQQLPPETSASRPTRATTTSLATTLVGVTNLGSDLPVRGQLRQDQQHGGIGDHASRSRPTQRFYNITGTTNIAGSPRPMPTTSSS